MMKPVSILLPGLDGTGDMFERFVAAAPSTLSLRVQPLPAGHPQSYQDLVDALLPALPAEPFALVAESFSGPLAVLIAERCSRVCAVTLCASFIRPPLPRMLARAPAFLFQRLPPRIVLELVLTGGDRRLAGSILQTIATVDKAVIRGRIAAALTVDVTQELQRLKQPLLYLRAECDRLVPARCAADVRTLKPSAQISSVNGPHLILQTRPRESWSLIEPFLEQAFLRQAVEAGGPSSP
jgi:pimeloyl-ACP methyl ester carboxylesterase